MSKVHRQARQCGPAVNPHLFKHPLQIGAHAGQGNAQFSCDLLVGQASSHAARHGGFAGVEAAPGSRKFVVDFKGGLLAQMEPDAPIEAVVNVANAELSGTVVERIHGTDIWRLVIDITAAEGAIVELSAHLAGFDRRLTENWLYQWINKA